jgi:ketosteroid isomerase-like protein
MTMSSSCRRAASTTGWCGRHSLHLALALLLAATTGAVAAPQDDAAAIRTALITWMDDFNAGRANQVCGLFAPTLRFDFRGTPERGYAEMCAQLHRARGSPVQRLAYTVTINEVLVSGDLAIVRLVWHSTVRPGASDSVTTDEPGLDVFARQPDGGWKIIRYLAYEE